MRMEFGAELDGSQDFFQMFWPTILAHKIDEDSPLWDIAPRQIIYIFHSLSSL
jgi:Inward rectifier potassium channel C-terminal domain